MVYGKITPSQSSSGKTFTTENAKNKLMNHDLMFNRDLADQHPISAITGLTEELAQLQLVARQLNTKIYTVRDSIDSSVNKLVGAETARAKQAESIIRSESKDQLDGLKQEFNKLSTKVDQLKAAAGTDSELLLQINQLETQLFLIDGAVKSLEALTTELSSKLTVIDAKVFTNPDAVNNKIAQLNVRYETIRAELTAAITRLTGEDAILARRLTVIEELDHSTTESPDGTEAVESLSKELANITLQLNDLDARLTSSVSTLQLDCTEFGVAIGDETIAGSIRHKINIIEQQQAQALVKIKEIQDAHVSDINSILNKLTVLENIDLEALVNNQASVEQTISEFNSDISKLRQDVSDLSEVSAENYRKSEERFVNVEDALDNLVDNYDSLLAADRQLSAQINAVNILLDNNLNSTKEAFSSTIAAESVRLLGAAGASETEVSIYGTRNLVIKKVTELSTLVNNQIDEILSNQSILNNTFLTADADLNVSVQNLSTRLDSQLNELQEKIKSVSGTTHFIGVFDFINIPSEGLSEGQTIRPEAAEAGDVCIVGDKEFIYSGETWVELGDSSAENERITAIENSLSALNADLGQFIATQRATISELTAAKLNVADFTKFVNELSIRETNRDLAIAESASKEELSVAVAQMDTAVRSKLSSEALDPIKESLDKIDEILTELDSNIEQLQTTKANHDTLIDFINTQNAVNQTITAALDTKVSQIDFNDLARTLTAAISAKLDTTVHAELVNRVTDLINAEQADRADIEQLVLNSITKAVFDAQIKAQRETIEALSATVDTKITHEDLTSALAPIFAKLDSTADANEIQEQIQQLVAAQATLLANDEDIRQLLTGKADIFSVQSQFDAHSDHLGKLDVQLYTLEQSVSTNLEDLQAAVETRASTESLSEVAERAASNLSTTRQILQAAINTKVDTDAFNTEVEHLKQDVHMLGHEVDTKANSLDLTNAVSRINEQLDTKASVIAMGAAEEEIRKLKNSNTAMSAAVNTKVDNSTFEAHVQEQTAVIGSLNSRISQIYIDNQVLGSVEEIQADLAKKASTEQVAEVSNLITAVDARVTQHQAAVQTALADYLKAEDLQEHTTEYSRKITKLTTDVSALGVQAEEAAVAFEAYKTEQASVLESLQDTIISNATEDIVETVMGQVDRKLEEKLDESVLTDLDTRINVLNISVGGLVDKDRLVDNSIDTLNTAVAELTSSKANASEYLEFKTQQTSINNNTSAWINATTEMLSAVSAENKDLKDTIQEMPSELANKVSKGDFETFRDTVTEQINEAANRVYEFEGDPTDVDAFAEQLTPNSGDVIVIKDPATLIKSAYSYDRTNGWIACNGNVAADKVILKNNITLAGDFEQIGNFTKSRTGSVSLDSAGISVETLLTRLLSRRIQPTVITPPSISLTLSGVSTTSYEMGTELEISYVATLNPGAYTFGPDTGIEASAWSVKLKNGDSVLQTLTTNEGTFDTVMVTDDSALTIVVEAEHTAGETALDNLGSASSPIVNIAANTVEAASDTITGYRNYFYGYTTNTTVDAATISAANIRALLTASKNRPTTLTTTGMQQIIVVVPSTANIATVEITNAVTTAPAGSVEVVREVSIPGANNYEPINYDVFYVKNAVAETGATSNWKITYKTT